MGFLVFSSLLVKLKTLLEITSIAGNNKNTVLKILNKNKKHKVLRL